MARSIWTGSVSFGLVNVPVKAYTAVRDHTVHFNQLQKGTGARIRHKDVSEKTGKEVDRDDIELGYEIRKGRYVTFDRDELDDLRPASTRAIDVSDFVSLDDIDPIYFERTYWLGPANDEAKESYHLLLAAMEEREQAAIGSVVMRNKQYLAAVRPLDGVLAMSTMRFADEVVPRSDIDELPSRRTKVDPKAKKLALQIIDSLASDWDPKQFHDTYTEQLHDIIRRKDEGKEVVLEDSTTDQADVVDLMAALRASVDAAKKGRAAKKPAKRTGKTTAPRKKAASPKKATARKKPAKKAAARKSA